jgi:hypothetical protein
MIGDAIGPAIVQRNASAFPGHPMTKGVDLRGPLNPPKRAARRRPSIEVLAGGSIVIGRPPELASPSHVLAMWEDGQVWLTERSRSTRKSKPHEPASKARRYVGRVTSPGQVGSASAR